MNRTSYPKPFHTFRMRASGGTHPQRIWHMRQQFTAALYPRKAKLRTLFFQFPHLIFSCKCKALQLQMSCQSRQGASAGRS
ncbi:hypothetical protein F9L02_01510 [Brucella intermedia]|nr:hypothetical protein F9L02_01510 [Brucella intermedia]